MSFYQLGYYVMRHTNQCPSTKESEFTASAGRYASKEGGKMTVTFDGAGGIMRGYSRKVEVPFMESTDPSSVGAIKAPLPRLPMGPRVKVMPLRAAR